MLMLKPLPIDRSAADARFSVITFIAHVGFATQELAHMLDSLDRVSRRVEWNHFVTCEMLGRCKFYDDSTECIREVSKTRRAVEDAAEMQHDLTS